MKKLAFVTLFSIFVSGCTFAVNVTDVHGTASDVGDEDTAAQNDISATVPIKAI